MAISVDLTPYYMGGFYGLAVLFVIIFSTARNEVMDAMQLFWVRLRYKTRFVRLKFIGADMNTLSIYAHIKDAMLKYQDKRFIINPAKAVMERGIRTFYFINDNASGHDFYHKPGDMLDKMLESIKSVQKLEETTQTKEGKISFLKKKVVKKEQIEVKDLSGKVHNIFDEPYRFDASTIQQTINQAQLSAPSVVEKLIQLFTSKNFLTLAIIAVVAAGLAAGLGFLTYNELAQAEFCRQAATTLTPS